MRLRFDWPLLAISIAILIIIYYFLGQSISIRNLSIDEIKERLDRLEDVVHEGDTKFQRLEEQVDDFQAKHTTDTKRLVNRSKCRFQYDSTPHADVQMLNVYDQIPFINIEGGEWGQGWDVTYDESSWNSQYKLKVFVVPHSHNDPGWLETFDKYYETQTELILDSMLEHLPVNPEMTFIWAEISYFSRWYEGLSDEKRQTVKTLLQRKQLEFVTGGWVMTDEANSHWLSILQEITEGQTWLKMHLNVTPKSSWSIDPFGHSSVVPYLLKGAGFENHLIQRTHYEVKKHLAWANQLEFNWRQPWDTFGDSDLFTHMMPFFSYDVSHTCGPNPAVCCQFDFIRLPGSSLSCPWRMQPTAITTDNVAERAHLLVDQYKKKASLYKTRSLLVPLGDDFRYFDTREWKAQQSNYDKLFEYINNDEAMNVRAKFGTLQEYFDSVRAEKELNEFPSLSGDFFTYADRDDEYWSGYYTSRPFHKHLDRVLMGYLRSAEMIHAWSPWNATMGLDELLQKGRRAHSLFQHHDGITGTAREHVVVDYYNQMTAALRACQFVIQQAAYRLLTDPQHYHADNQTTFFSIDDSRFSDEKEPRPVIALNARAPKRIVVLHNSVPRKRTAIVEFIVSTPFVKVERLDGIAVASQVTPVWAWYKMSGRFVPQPEAQLYRLTFKATVPPLGLATYIIQSTNSVEESTGTDYADIQILIDDSEFSVSLPDYPGNIKYLTPREVTIQIEYKNLTATFDANGLLKAVTTESVTDYPVRLEFMKYGVKQAEQTSGAYIFLPSGEAEPLPLADMSSVLVTSGPLEASCVTALKYIVHGAFIREGEQSLEIRNLIDIRSTLNTEIVMRLSSSIDSKATFYTDLNGFQYMKRSRFEKIPLQGNFYPVPSGIYVQDKRMRLTLLTAQPLGGSSLASGQIEVMQDRRLDQDDFRGLVQGVQDNVPTLNVFKLHVERIDSCAQRPPDYAGGYLTETMHTAMNELLYPVEKLIWQNGNGWPGVLPHFGQDHQQLDIGTEIPVLRNLINVRGSLKNRKSSIGLMLNRYHLEQCDGNEQESGDINLLHVLGKKKIVDIFRTPLTMLEKQQKLVTSTIQMCPMEINAFIVDR